MKKLTMLALGLMVIIGFNSCSNPKEKNGWTEDDLKGKVQSYTEISYKAEDRLGEIEKGSRERIYNIYKDFQKKFDEKGNKIETNWYKSDGSLDSKSIYKYDEKGNVMEENRYKSDGSLDEKWTAKYDEKGNEIEKNFFYSDGSLSYKYIYQFDEKGNLIEENESSSDGSFYNKHTYKYNEKGNKIETNFFYLNDLFCKNTYKYDEKGNEIEINIYKSDGSFDYKETYKYEYDEKGNWVRKIEYRDEIPKYILEREYEYYK